MHVIYVNVKINMTNFNFSINILKYMKLSLRLYPRWTKKFTNSHLAASV